MNAITITFNRISVTIFSGYFIHCRGIRSYSGHFISERTIAHERKNNKNN